MYELTLKKLYKLKGVYVFKLIPFQLFINIPNSYISDLTEQPERDK